LRSNEPSVVPAKRSVDVNPDIHPKQEGDGGRKDENGDKDLTRDRVDQGYLGIHPREAVLCRFLVTSSSEHFLELKYSQQSLLQARSGRVYMYVVHNDEYELLLHISICLAISSSERSWEAAVTWAIAAKIASL